MEVQQERIDPADDESARSSRPEEDNGTTKKEIFKCSSSN
jgi:hypothetical protein